jgi:membrane associated rhomboid family serine protease
MPRTPRYSDVAYSIGPGPLSPAIKILIIANVVAFLASLAVPTILIELGLVPVAFFGRLAFWQLVTYMFLHGGIGHLLFNMLSLWMFGTDLEKTWGTRFFTKYYFVTGIGAGVVCLLWAISPLPLSGELYNSAIIGASGAIYGVLLAYALTFPHRVIVVFLLFPLPAKYAVMIFGAIAFLSSVGSSGSGVAHTAHLGGLLVGYLYLKGLRGRPLDELRYRWLRWRVNRARNKFGVYSGGRSGNRDDDSWKSDWKKHIH